MGPILAVDFGSTYTKAVLIDADAGEIVAVAHTPSTVATDITVGLRRVLGELSAKSGTNVRAARALACSSAAGGMRVAVVGLVPALSMEAARRAALGAGAKIVGAFGFKLTPERIRELADARPDILLLAGGTDGGDEETILHNARAIARSSLEAPVIVAGNVCVREECMSRLGEGGKRAFAAANLLPEVGRIDVAEVHRIIRDLFIHHITRAKGIDRVREHLDLACDIIPTPSAVLEAARLIADGNGAVPGFGDTVVIDVGGATTDVHSIASGLPTRPGAVLRGLPELRIKRTVEGDLGMRVNAPTIVERFGRPKLKALAEVGRTGFALAESDIDDYAARVSIHTEHVPGNAVERMLDHALGRAAVRIAMERHAGAVREVFTSSGIALVQEGKDLTDVAAVVGVGGVLVHGSDARLVLEAALGRGADPLMLLPTCPALYLDRKYVLFGIGLMSAIAPDAALATARRVLEPL
jgi:uncharacterized protein (TIGR01319 family)